MMQINDLLVNQTDLVVVPGEFSYGDYLRCDAIAARAPVMNPAAASCSASVARRMG
jgi:phosphoribosylformylglycinamidine (FGAM) synthase-like amidotransferase family enzyme